MKELSELRRELGDGYSCGGRLPRELRVKVARTSEKFRKKHGWSFQRFAEEIDISQSTLANWRRIDRSASRKRTMRTTQGAALRTVSVEEESRHEERGRGQLAVRLSTGIEIAGLSLADIAALHRSLLP